MNLRLRKRQLKRNTNILNIVFFYNQNFYLFIFNLKTNSHESSKFFFLIKLHPPTQKPFLYIFSIWRRFRFSSSLKLFKMHIDFFSNNQIKQRRYLYGGDLDKKNSQMVKVNFRGPSTTVEDNKLLLVQPLIFIKWKSMDIWFRLWIFPLNFVLQDSVLSSVLVEINSKKFNTHFYLFLYHHFSSSTFVNLNHQC